MNRIQIDIDWIYWGYKLIFDLFDVKLNYIVDVKLNYNVDYIVDVNVYCRYWL